MPPGRRRVDVDSRGATDREPLHRGRRLVCGHLERHGGERITTLGCGEVVGELSFLDSRPPVATVTAEETSEVLSLSRDRLQAQLDSDPGFAARFYRALGVFMAHRLRRTVRQFGYGGDQSLVQTYEYDDELDADLLDQVSLAGARFDWMMRRLRGTVR